MTLAAIFPLLALLQPPPATTAWGNPDNGLKLGIAIEAKKDGPAILRCYMLNDNGIPFILSSNEVAPPIPSFMLKNNHEGAWTFTPPSAYPLVSDGFAWEIVLQPHMPTLIYSSRSWFPMTAGTYEITATYSPMRRPMHAGKSVPTRIEFQSGPATLVIRPEDVHPAFAAGSG